MRQAVSLGLRALSLMLAPVVVWVILLGEPIVQLLFQRGAFDPAATWGTNLAWIGYLGWIYAGAWGAILTNAFYALQETKTVVVIGILGTVLYLVLSFLLYKPLGFLGLALALSAMAGFNAIVFILVLRRRLGGIEGRRILVTLRKTLVAAGVMALALAVSRSGLAAGATLLTGHQSLRLIGYLALAGSLSLLVYLVTTALLRCEEWHDLTRSLRRTLAGVKLVGRAEP